MNPEVIKQVIRDQMTIATSQLHPTSVIYDNHIGLPRSVYFNSNTFDENNKIVYMVQSLGLTYEKHMYTFHDGFQLYHLLINYNNVQINEFILKCLKDKINLISNGI